MLSVHTVSGTTDGAVPVLRGPMVIALDGPAGSGKSTVAKAVAARLGIEHLDTGAMYRSVAWAAQDRGVDVYDSTALARLAATSVIRVGVDGLNRQVVAIDGVDITSAIREPEIDALTGPVASNPAVRAALVAQQREWAMSRGAGVMEGRDISSVVFPDAPVQVFLTADPEERARRRAVQSGAEVEIVLADMVRRDHVDSTRTADPLQVASGATVLDTTGLTIDEVVDRIVAMIPPAALSSEVAPRKPVALSVLPSGGGSTRQVSSQPARVLNRREKALYGTVHFLVRCFTRWWVRVEMIGRENVPATGAYIVSANHRSVVDFLLVGPVTRRRMRYLGKDTVWDAKWFVPIANTLGGIPVARGTVDRDSMKRCVEALGGGEPLVLFPEGMRKSGPAVQELFDGVAFIAIKADVPILPVGIGGSEMVMPKGTFFPRRRHVTMIIGEPIYPPEVGRSIRKAAPEMTSQLHQTIQGLFDEAMHLNAKK
jgi:pantoate ligase / CMP/dCMP kinase